MMTRHAVRAVLGVALVGLVFAPAVAQQMYIYPTQNQSPDQQNRDRYECHRGNVPLDHQSGWTTNREQDILI